jgi:hypothetical protein
MSAGVTESHGGAGHAFSMAVGLYFTLYSLGVSAELNTKRFEAEREPRIVSVGPPKRPNMPTEPERQQL